MKDGRVVKGVNFLGLRDAGDPVAVAKRYNDEGADEITFLDITASSDNRDTILHVIEEVAEHVFIPLTVGGGVRSVADIRRLLNAGADKVSINTAAVTRPELVSEAAAFFGAQAIVAAVDAKAANPDNSRWGNLHPRRPQSHRPRCRRMGAGNAAARRGRNPAHQHGQGRHAPGLQPAAHPRRQRSRRHPRYRLRRVGSVQHLIDGIQEGKADAVLAASIFHFGEISIRRAKEAMREAGIEVRL